MSRALLAQTPIEPWSGKERALIAGAWLVPTWDDEKLSYFNIELMPYHWDDRSKLARDIEFIEKTFENFVLRFTEELNRIHGKEYSSRFWRILLGEWLYLIIQVTFDRLETLKTASLLFDAKIEDGNFSSVVNPPVSIIEFLEEIKNPNWNSQLLLFIDNLLTKKRSFTAIPEISNWISNFRLDTTTPVESISRIRNILNRFSIQFNKFMPRIQMSSMYLMPKDLLRLSSRLCSIPLVINPRIPFSQLKNIDRSRVNLKRLGDGLFESLLSEVLIRTLPVSYLEGFEACVAFIEETYGKTNPKAIVTANDFSGNDSWKFWAARSAESGSKILILQHGGLYGINSRSLMQKYELSIADTYFSWGWVEKKTNNVIPAPATKLISHKKRTRQNNVSAKRLLLVTFEMPLLSYWLASMPIGPQVKRAVEANYNLISEFSEDLREALSIRPFPKDFGLNQRETIEDMFKDIAISEKNSTFYDDLKDSKLVLSTYNATTFIETMNMNIPTIICWNPQFWEVTSEAQLHFDRLKSCKVFFDSPRECAIFLNANWDKLADWWESEDVQSAIHSFLDAYGYTGHSPLRELQQKIEIASRN